MPPHARTPVLVGVGVVQQREEDPRQAREPLELMVAALERAAEDAGSRKLLARADSIRAPKGFWSYPDPCRLVAERVGASRASTELADVGVLQTTLFGGAAQDIAAGRADVVLLTGAEARYRSLRARISGNEEAFTAQPDAKPDRRLRPTGQILSRLEAMAGIAMPVSQFAMVENALRAAEGIGLDRHLREVAELWSGMSRVAAGNPDAWSREVVAPDTIREPRGRNRMLAFPYTKLHNSDWNVDQAAGLALCSVETARALGIPETRWVFPLGVAESNHMVPLTQRRALHRAPGYAFAAERALAGSSLTPAEVEYLELYSCFPSALRVQLRELDIPRNRPVTVTGGMAFAGGPLNNFVLQALARMAQVLREDPGSLGLVNAVSGMLTKQGVSLWSTEASADFRFEDVSDCTADATGLVEVVGDAEGPGDVASYTVFYDGEKPSRAVLLCDLEDGRRGLVVSEDPALADVMTREEFCARRVQLGGQGQVELL